MPRYRYITKIPDFELARILPGRKEVLNEGDTFETDQQISASIIEQIPEAPAPVAEAAPEPAE